MRQTRAASSARPRSCSSMSLPPRAAAAPCGSRGRLPAAAAPPRKASESAHECRRCGPPPPRAAARVAVRAGSETSAQARMRVRLRRRRPSGSQGHRGRAQAERGPARRVPLLRRDRLQRLHELRPRRRPPRGASSARAAAVESRAPRRSARLRRSARPWPAATADGRHRRSPEPERRVLRAVAAARRGRAPGRRGPPARARRPRAASKRCERGLRASAGSSVQARVSRRVDGARRRRRTGRAGPRASAERFAATAAGQVAGSMREPRQLLAQRRPVAPRPPCQRSSRSSARGWPGAAEPRTVEGLPGHRGAPSGS